MRIGSRKYGYLYIGPGWVRDVDVEISAGVWRRANCAEGEIAWHWSARVSWNWLPPRIYHAIAPPADVLGSSAAWTGREFVFAGIDWRRWCLPRLSYTFIRD